MTTPSNVIESMPVNIFARKSMHGSSLNIIYEYETLQRDGDTEYTRSDLVSNLIEAAKELVELNALEEAGTDDVREDYYAHLYKRKQPAWKALRAAIESIEGKQ